MSYDAATLSLAILAIPGLIWTMIDAANRHPAQSGQFIYLIRVFVFGSITYIVLSVIYYWTNRNFDVFTTGSVIRPLEESQDEILWSVPLAVVLSLVWVTGKTNLIVFRLLNRLGVSDYSGCIDIWEYSLSKQAGLSRWIVIRDFKERVTYMGKLLAYSDREDIRELTLTDVSVFDFDSTPIYEIPALYLARPLCDVAIEFGVKEERSAEESS